MQRGNDLRRKELCGYIFWGVLSAILNVGLAQLLVWGGIDYKISNAVTLIIVKLFCYFTNKVFVFKTPFESFGKFIREAVRFILARGISFFIDYIGVIMLVEAMKQSFFISKCLMSMITIMLNYILSKKLVFYEQGK